MQKACPCNAKRDSELATNELQVKIVNRYGLHARPAMQFVELANNYTSKVEVSNGVLTVDAKSIMSVMRLAATKDTTLTISADGADAEDATASLAKLVEEPAGSGVGMGRTGPCRPRDVGTPGLPHDWRHTGVWRVRAPSLSIRTDSLHSGLLPADVVGGGTGGGTYIIVETDRGVNY